MRRAVLINHIIPDRMAGDGADYYNNDPITGQAGWYDARVKVYPSELHEVWPTVDPRKPAVPASGVDRLAYSTRKGAH